jgi:hypothetical protein
LGTPAEVDETPMGGSSTPSGGRTSKFDTRVPPRFQEPILLPVPLLLLFRLKYNNDI